MPIQPASNNFFCQARRTATFSWKVMWRFSRNSSVIFAASQARNSARKDSSLMVYSSSKLLGRTIRKIKRNYFRYADFTLFSIASCFRKCNVLEHKSSKKHLISADLVGPHLAGQCSSRNLIPSLREGFPPVTIVTYFTGFL